jgi:hypothetical protein
MNPLPKIGLNGIIKPMSTSIQAMYRSFGENVFGNKMPNVIIVNIINAMINEVVKNEKMYNAISTLFFFKPFF